LWDKNTLGIYNLDENEIQYIWRGAIYLFAYDTESGGLVIEPVEQKNNDESLFAFPSITLQPQNIFDDGVDCLAPYIAKPGSFLFSKVFIVYEIDQNLDVNFIRYAPTTCLPLQSSSNDSWVWFEPWPHRGQDYGVWISAFYGDTIQHIFNQPAYSGSWSPDGETLFFFGDEDETINLYVSRYPDFPVEMVMDNITQYPIVDIIWMEP